MGPAWVRHGPESGLLASQVPFEGRGVGGGDAERIPEPVEKRPFLLGNTAVPSRVQKGRFVDLELPERDVLRRVPRAGHRGARYALGEALQRGEEEDQRGGRQEARHVAQLRGQQAVRPFRDQVEEGDERGGQRGLLQRPPAAARNRG